MFYLFMSEDNYLLPVGDSRGYKTLDEAEREALKRVDDALPRNTVRIFHEVGYAYFGGDGGAYLSGKDE